MRKTPRFCNGLALGAALALSLAGCGGGGSGGNRTLNGLLLGVDSAPLAGDTVVYDKGAAGQQSAVTDAQGRYRLVVARDAITGGDTLTITDAAGHLVDVVSVTIRTDVPSTSLITVAPPSPPDGQI